MELFNLKGELTCLKLNDDQASIYFSHGEPIALVDIRIKFDFLILDTGDIGLQMIDKHGKNIRRVIDLYNGCLTPKRVSQETFAETIKNIGGGLIWE